MVSLFLVVSTGLPEEPGNGDVERRREPHERVERRVAVRARATAEHALEPSDGFDGDAGALRELGLGEAELDALRANAGGE